MPRYLFQITYTETGLQGILKEGGSQQREAMQTAIKSLEGWLEAIYFSFGEIDMYVIAQLPDNVSASAFSMIASSAGAAKVKTIVLISPEEIDTATKKTINYCPPGE
jgi:uncharacterized protein with GYD domain